jgi:hypothetical protein
VGAGRGSHLWVSSPPPTRLMTSLPVDRPSVPLLNCRVTPDSIVIVIVVVVVIIVVIVIVVVVVVVFIVGWLVCQSDDEAGRL